MHHGVVVCVGRVLLMVDSVGVVFVVVDLWRCFFCMALKVWLRIPQGGSV